MAEAGGEAGGGRRVGKRRSSRKAPSKRSANRKGAAHANQRASLISAIGHPLRRQILRELANRGEALSPAALGREVGTPIGTLSYHVRVLLRLGAVREIGQRMVRGAVEHFYETLIEDDPPIEALLEETREADEQAS